MENGRDFYRIRDVLDLYLSKNKYIAYRVKSQEALKAWDTVVDNYIKQHTKTIFIKNKTLFIRTDSTVLANELSLREKELVDKLNSVLRIPLISRVKFKTGDIRKKDRKRESKTAKPKEITLKTINNIDRMVQDINEDDLRFIMKKFLISLAMRNGGVK